LKANGGFDDNTARRLSRHPGLMTADRSAALLNHEHRLFLYQAADGLVRPLGGEVKGRRELTLSPDARHAAWLQDNNLYVVSTETGEIRQLTADGADTLLNGLLDWVYQEEVYGRGRWRAYWWAPDGSHIAYLQLDLSAVPVYPLVNYLPTHPTTNNLRWPKAGDPNAKIRLGVVRPEGGETVWVDLSKYAGQEILIVAVAWAPDGRVVYQVQDREQRWLDLNDADPTTGAARTLLHEGVAHGWIDREESTPHWLADGSFLWFSVSDGYRHLYHCTRDGEFIARVTEGPWEVRELHGVDEANGLVYFSGMADSPVERHAYRAPLSGGRRERLTRLGCTHAVEIDPQFQYMIDTFSNLTTPPKVYLRKIDGQVVRKLSDNDVPALREWQQNLPRLVRVPTPRGYALNALLVLPLDYSPAGTKKYPVFCPVYGGPHATMVSNSWHGREAMFWAWLAQQGYIVWACDPHSASGEGAVSAWRAYLRLGPAELEDYETGIQYLIDHYNADPARVAIFGHSYGGTMAAYALTHGSKFTAGIAIAGVMDWRNYDSIYTERFMRTPQNNPDGYTAGSVVAGAKDLHGKLLILHGAQDDNVHFQNSLQLLEALQEAGKQFEFMVYPSADHGAWRYYQHGPRPGMDFLRRHFGTPVVE
ncbi:MAG: S9 family peptidase, partial [Planctomycetota bacterium]